jgi:hypothetical protein
LLAFLPDALQFPAKRPLAERHAARQSELLELIEIAGVPEAEKSNLFSKGLCYLEQGTFDTEG